MSTEKKPRNQRNMAYAIVLSLGVEPRYFEDGETGKPYRVEGIEKTDDQVEVTGSYLEIKENRGYCEIVVRPTGQMRKPLIKALEDRLITPQSWIDSHTTKPRPQSP